MTRRAIAVIGAGVAGLTAAHVLQREVDVTLYEASDRLGGHAHTHELSLPNGHLLGIDTGFIVHNRRTYPTLLRLFDELGVATQESEMSMSVSCAGCGLQYAGGRGVSGLLPFLQAARGLRYLRMLREITRFYRRANEFLAAGDERTLGEFVADHHFSRYMVDHFVTPLVATVWSTAPTQAGDYPARYLFSFLRNHGLLQVGGSPTWYTVVGGSVRYVERVAKGLTAVESASPVRSVRRLGSRVEVRDEGDRVSYFDGAVIATHPDQAMALLSEPTAAQANVLGVIPYTRNAAVLHSDRSLLPSPKYAQASWNYSMPSCDSLPARVKLSYNMNRLQRLDALGAQDTFILSLNSEHLVDPALVIARMVYEHPVYTTESVAARARLPELNDGVLAFAGAYHGWGFHEDGAHSGVVAAASLGVAWSS